MLYFTLPSILPMKMCQYGKYVYENDMNQDKETHFNLLNSIKYCGDGLIGNINIHRSGKMELKLKNGIKLIIKNGYKSNCKNNVLNIIAKNTKDGGEKYSIAKLIGNINKNDHFVCRYNVKDLI